MLKAYTIPSEYKSTIKLTLIDSQENLGYAKANNKAVKIAKGKYLIIMNSDIEVLDSAIEKLYTFYKNQTQFQYVGAKLFNSDMTPQASAAPFYTPFIVFMALFLRGDYWGFTRYSPQTIKKVDWVSGACFITTKDLYEKILGFDENIFMYMDEVDFFYRASLKKLKVGFYPESHFIHLGSASSKGRSQPIIQVYKGFLYFYKNHYPQNLSILKNMLKLKAFISLSIGKIINIIKHQKENYLTETYEKALEIVNTN
jgi:GT2 family glycosyltransferase